MRRTDATYSFVRLQLLGRSGLAETYTFVPLSFSSLSHAI